MLPLFKAKNSQLIIGRLLLEGGGSVRQDVPKARIFLTGR